MAQRNALGRGQDAVFSMDEVKTEGSSCIYVIEKKQKNKFSVGEIIEIMKPDGSNVQTTVLSIVNEEGREQESAPHPQQKLRVLLSEKASHYDLLRKKSMCNKLILVVQYRHLAAKILQMF